MDTAPDAAPDATIPAPSVPVVPALLPVARTMKSRYGGSCRGCGGTYGNDAEIIWTRMEGVIGCPRCGGRSVGMEGPRRFSLADWAPLWAEMKSLQGKEAIDAWVDGNKVRLRLAALFFREYPEVLPSLTDEQRAFLPILARKAR